MVANSTENAIGVYLHIPFCRNKCPYCDFNSYPINKAPIDRQQYIEALCHEIESSFKQPRWTNRIVGSVYFGGGTPTALERDSLSRLFNTLNQCTTLNSSTEITIEANPETLVDAAGSALAKHCRNLGVNRISLGVQSFQDEKLRWLGRTHSAADCRQAIATLKHAGFDNICIDLMFGLPGEQLKNWQNDLEVAVEQNASHISAYCLSLNEGCHYYADYKNGSLMLPGDEAQRELFEKASSMLKLSGFEHYEISNFAKPGLRSLHNQCYWLGNDYLGLGAGAHSFHSVPRAYRKKPPRHSGLRWSNKQNPLDYKNAISGSGSRFEMIERLSLIQAQTEYFMLRLRQADGFTPGNYQATFGSTLPTIIHQALEGYAEQGFINFDGQRISLSCQGFLLADRIVQELICHL